jgi:hypothetical protein
VDLDALVNETLKELESEGAKSRKGQPRMAVTEAVAC